MRRSRSVSSGTVLYLIVGLVVALSNGCGITDFSSLLSFLLALFLWPLVLLGIDLHVDLRRLSSSGRVRGRGPGRSPPPWSRWS